MDGILYIYIIYIYIYVSLVINHKKYIFNVYTYVICYDQINNSVNIKNAQCMIDHYSHDYLLNMTSP